MSDPNQNATLLLTSDTPIAPALVEPEAAGPPPEPEVDPLADAHYRLFLDQLQALTSAQARNAKEIASAIGVREIQVKDWLARAAAEGRTSRVGRTARYRWRAALAQGVLFG
jgi:hypothetical protein